MVIQQIRYKSACCKENTVIVFAYSSSRSINNRILVKDNSIDSRLRPLNCCSRSLWHSMLRYDIIFLMFTNFFKLQNTHARLIRRKLKHTGLLNNFYRLLIISIRIAIKLMASTLADSPCFIVAIVAGHQGRNIS